MAAAGAVVCVVNAAQRITLSALSVVAALRGEWTLSVALFVLSW